MLRTLRCLTLAALLPAAMTPCAHANDDPYLWLEEVQGEKALAWVRERNAVSRRQLEAHPRFAAMRERFVEILNSRDRIPYVTRHGDWYYNLWRDDKNKRGLWRRTTLDEYRKPLPAWETVLNLDALAARESENWVWARASCFAPSYRRCLLALSRGGADAVVMREFDTVDKRFIDGGFALPEAKSDVTWIDEDTLYVGTDFGPGSLTESGYPRIIKRWRRGQPLVDAVTVFEGETKDVAASVTVDRTPGFERTVFERSLDFYNSRQFLLAPDGTTAEIDKPRDTSVNFRREHVLLELRSDWKVGNALHPRGSLLVADAQAYLGGQRRLTTLFTPTATRSLAGYTVTRTRIVLNVLDNVASRLEEWHRAGGRWLRRDVKAPFPGTLGVSGVHDPLLARDTLPEHYAMTYVDFLTPDSLWLARTGTDQRERLKSRPAFFDSTGMRVEQRFASSKDGARVPYFVVWPKGASADGTHPTLLYGYGGFEQSMQPWYSAGYGNAWYAHGGVLVVANIRGGGEFGPGWHQAAIKANKQKSYDDFIAVAEDLIATKVTSARHLGIEGGSNGGLLVGAVMLQRPELFNAVVCQVPLLDMKRYHKLLAGASWMAEYGNPDDPADWATIATYSPYQNVKPQHKLPKVLFTTSTRDDRVHPGHARKMAARMLEQGHELLYYENIEGGHGGAADNFQRADIMALEFAFLWQQLGK
jgi:prolyl oligopeptidase